MTTQTPTTRTPTTRTPTTRTPTTRTHTNRAPFATVPCSDAPVRRESGQSTVEYALLLLGAAAIALVVVAWVTRTDLIGRLFDTVVGRILSQA